MLSNKYSIDFIAHILLYFITIRMLYISLYKTVALVFFVFVLLIIVIYLNVFKIVYMCFVYFIWQFPRHSRWRKIVNLRNRPEFEHSFHEIRDVMKNSKAWSTIKNYDYYYRKFQNWCNLHSLSSLPASTATVAIYLNSLVQRSVPVSVLYSNYYSIKWYHDLNLHSNPCDDKLISMFLEGGKRTLSKPIIKKDPITPDILNKIIDTYGKVI